ncbi:MAG: DUF4350 domain-containing protein, partial [Candidatus Thorarchaeota archaeon]|nr:DUF4350 domain-containing protein [Candidatus Thorarchaeota archaeon]
LTETPYAELSPSLTGEAATAAASFNDNKQLPVSILVYTEYVDNNTGLNGELKNTMESIDETFGYKYTYGNLTDYTELTAMLPGHDILLIPEQELAHPDNMTDVGIAWSSTLTEFVNDGGIVILMDCYGMTYGFAAPTMRIYNASGLVQVGSVRSFSGTTINLVNVSDALARGVAASYAAPNGAMAFDTNDNTTVVDDGTDTVVLHKIMGRGHVVVLGFDMYERNANSDALLANAIRLHRHVVFDDSHNQPYEITNELAGFADDLVADGYAVSTMQTFDPALLAACDILVLTRGYLNYTTQDVNAIDDFVNDGGGLFITTDAWDYGSELDIVIEQFGVVRNKTHGLEDSDDGLATDLQIIFGTPTNFNNHSITLGTYRVEFYWGSGFIEMPANAQSLIVTDTDGTATFGGEMIANGTAASIAFAEGDGRIAIFGDTDALLSTVDDDSDATNNYFDSNNDDFFMNSIRWLFGAGVKERIVLFDESHGQNFYLNASYYGLSNYLTELGYTIHWMWGFSESLIDQAHVLVIQDGDDNYTASEIATIEAFVARGGGLFIAGGSGVYGLQADLVGNEFGVDMNNTGHLLDTDDWAGQTSHIIYNETNIGSHPITSGVGMVATQMATGFIDIGDAVPLLTADADGTCTWSDLTPADGTVIMAAKEHGLGRIVVASDYRFVRHNEDPDIDGIPMLYGYDNDIFVANIFNWLAENRAPAVHVINPDGGETVTGSHVIHWTITEPNLDSTISTVSYSGDGGSTWHVLGSGLAGTSYTWDTTGLDDSAEVLIRVTAEDYELTGVDTSDAVFTVDNHAPEISSLAHSLALESTNVTISADVSDISDIQSVICSYSIDNGTTWNDVAMTVVSGNTYECDIGAFPAGTTVQWFVEATDDLSQVSTSEIEEFTVLALGDLTSILIIAGVAVVVIIVLVIIMKKRGKE